MPPETIGIVEEKPVISCGMYAFTIELRQAWGDFFEHIELEDEMLTLVPGEFELRFSNNDDTYTSKRSAIAQTCGYPYLKKWRESHIPVCVPVFDIDGCQNQNYLSWFIKHKTSNRKNLEDFRNTRVAINNAESNSGMNVLRYATSSLAKNGLFFSAVKVTGAHYQSMFAVAAGDADIASIDAVSFYFACQKYPELAEKIEIFGESTMTVGLPFIQKRTSVVSAEKITNALNKATRRYLQNGDNLLRLNRFERVDEEAYLPMLKIEHSAANSGYRTLA